jgi:Concanavalin A-like lectin/glucanases superfamily
VTTHATARLLSIVMAVTLIAAAVAAPPVQAAAPLPQDTYLGISADYPTGSPAIGLDSLVAAYDMATVTPDGQLHDFSGQQHHGTVLRTTLVPGLFGLARQFASLVDAVHLPETPTLALDGPLSLALWVRIDRLGRHQHLLACDAQFTLWITPDNSIRFTDTLGEGFETVDALAPATWYSLVAVFYGTAGDVLTTDNIAVFLNGQPVDGKLFGAWSPGGLYAQDACYIGFESHQGDPAHQERPFVGVIDELLIFARALTVAEIAIHARPHP